MAESSARQSIANIGRLLSAAGVKPLAPSHAVHAPSMPDSTPAIDTLLASTQRTLEATALDITTSLSAESEREMHNVNISYNNSVLTAMCVTLDAIITANDAGPKLAVDLRAEIDTMVRSEEDSSTTSTVIIDTVKSARASCSMLDHVVGLGVVTPIITNHVNEAIAQIKNDIMSSELTKPPPVIETPQLPTCEQLH